MPSISDIAGGISKLVGKGKHNSYALTPVGKTKSDNFEDSNSYRYDVLIYLDDNSPATAREVADKTHIEEKIVVHILDEFEKDGWVVKK